MPTILFVCDSRTRLASMAALFLKRAAEARQLVLDVHSATFAPLLERPEPAAVVAMAEEGLSLDEHVPKVMTRDLALGAHRIIWISVDGSQTGLPIEHWDLSLPSEAPEAPGDAERGDPAQSPTEAMDSADQPRVSLAEARRLRDALRRRTERLAQILVDVGAEGPGATEPSPKPAS